ncbi:MAG: class I SAM-dependent methyltransferase [Flavobacteriaceae bacterium]|nr:class I SAM-dependent methyltransferase [Flavobacteriaceae bacterium]
MKDILGKALLDYHQGNYSEDIITETNISEEDEMPLPYLFRSFSEMNSIEKEAIQKTKGRVLDVGCGAGIHSIHLQKKGFDITAIDVSEGAVKVCKEKGLKDVRNIELLALENEKFDTILLLMNGTGIFKKLIHIAEYLQKLKTLLLPEGQILIDSSDLRYMYDTGEEGGIIVPADRYYGELEFTMSYKGEKSESFDWLYLDPNLFENACLASGLDFNIIKEGENFDYLAQLTNMD